MTTLEAIGFTITGGGVVCAISLAMFGAVNYARHPFVAPRASARPLNVIYAGYSPKDDSQRRGNPFTGWIPWVMSLSYDTLLQGVPGTGTRKHGTEGSMLNVNLDGIILLRFHALCLRISALATVLFLVFLLPNYISAQCYRLSEEEAQGLPQCASSVYNLTNYEQTTIANIPTLQGESLWDTIVTPTHNTILARLYVVVICFSVVSLYMLYQLYHEWITVLALRRVYYLESDVWGDRRNELHSTLLYEETRKDSKRKHQAYVSQENNDKRIPNAPIISPKNAKEPHLTDRDPWIPHPEQRDTVPNIALYSVLVGGLPLLPDSDLADVRDSIDWQLNLASSFFDHCIPNQPGFSSSVAAVTIIPSANDLSQAWRAWYMAAKRLRRLRFIRQQISERRHFEIDEEQPNESQNGQRARTGSGGHRMARRSSLWSPAYQEEEEDESVPREIYQDATKNQEYYRQVLGSLAESEEESHVFEAMNFGPEQTAIYSREFAQSAAACCPNGCFEGRVRNIPIDDLLEMEKHVSAQVHDANLALKQARKYVAKKQEATSERGDVHKSRASLEDMHMPQDLGLESELFKASIHNESKEDGQSRTSSLTRQSTSAILRDELNPNLHGRPPLKAINEDPNDHSISSYGIDEFQMLRDIESGGVSMIDESEREKQTTERCKRKQWQQVESIVLEMQKSRKDGTRTRSIPSGSWRCPTNFRSLFSRTTDKATELTEWAKYQSTLAIDDISRESTYAVVTFTSRQAAVAARHCMADGRASGRWETDSQIPIPPLADAAPWDIMACRSCCRPVTLSINERQKNLRNYM